MSLPGVAWPALLTTFDHEMIADFCATALGHGWRHDRGVGCFA